MRRTALARATVVAAIVALPVAAPSPALAHGDARLVDQPFDLAPGASASFDAEVHYHRLVGRLEADGPIAVTLVESATGALVVQRPTAASVPLNELVRCCEVPWTPHTLVVENPGDQPVTVDGRAGLVHDDLAVMVDGAEDGTRATVVLFALGWAVLLWRLARQPGRERTSSSRALRLLGALVAALLALAVGGTVRYGGWGAPALVAALADVPVLPVNRLVSRTSLLLAVGIGAWYWASARWARARVGVAPATWVRTGLLLAAVPLGAGVAVALAYGRAGLPVAWIAAATVPMLAVMSPWGRRLDGTPAPVPAPSTAGGRRAGA